MIDYTTAKECADCKIPIQRGNRSYRCKPCQAFARLQQRKKWNAKYGRNHREQITALNVAYQNTKRATDPQWREWEKTKYHKRRALIEGNGGIHTTSEWLALVVANNNECANCHEDRPLTRDHIVPLSRGGTNDISNIQPLCGSCNSSKGAKLWLALNTKTV